MALLYGRAGRFTAQNGGSGPGQVLKALKALQAHGVSGKTIVIGGGASRSPLVRQIMADTTGYTVALPQTQEPVLLGAAMLGAVASGAHNSINAAMAGMSALGRLSEPTRPELADFHRRKRGVHKMLRQLDRDSREAMKRDPGAAPI